MSSTPHLRVQIVRTRNVPVGEQDYGGTIFFRTSLAKEEVKHVPQSSPPPPPWKQTRQAEFWG